MKLQTAIPARRDGTLNVQGLDKNTYKFTADTDGVLTGDVEHEESALYLLGTGNFYPENAEDFDAALRLSTDGEDDFVDDDDNEDMNAPPLEGNTATKAAKAPKPAKAGK